MPVRFLLCAVATLAVSCAPASDPPAASQREPSLFAAGELTTVNGIAFDDGGRRVYVSRWVDEVDGRQRPRARIFMHELAGEQWGPPQAVSFSRDFTDYQPVLSHDGSKLFFTSTRPVPGTTAEVRQNIWFVDRDGDGDGDGWQTPRMAQGLSTSGWDGYAVPTRTGRLYFVSDRSGGLGATDIWMADPVSDDEYGAPVNVAALNSADSDSDLFVDPDEQFIIFHRFVEAANDIDLWIAFRVGDGWSAPRLLDGATGSGWELSPTVSSDGRTFFFARDSAIYSADLCALLRESEHLAVCR
jgi:hypothetical protein